MILIDTSAWIEYLRDTGSSVCEAVQDELARDIAVADPVRMEVLAGARNERHLLQLRRLLARGTSLRTEAIDFEQAAMLYRQCRENGETIYKWSRHHFAELFMSPMLHLDCKDIGVDMLHLIYLALFSLRHAAYYAFHRFLSTH